MFISQTKAFNIHQAASTSADEEPGSGDTAMVNIGYHRRGARAVMESCQHEGRRHSKPTLWRPTRDSIPCCSHCSLAGQFGRGGGGGGGGGGDGGGGGADGGCVHGDVAAVSSIRSLRPPPQYSVMRALVGEWWPDLIAGCLYGVTQLGRCNSSVGRQGRFSMPGRWPGRTGQGPGRGGTARPLVRRRDVPDPCTPAAFPVRPAGFSSAIAAILDSDSEARAPAMIRPKSGTLPHQILKVCSISKPWISKFLQCRIHNLRYWIISFDIKDDKKSFDTKNFRYRR
jgi:hypothetical protein